MKQEIVEPFIRLEHVDYGWETTLIGPFGQARCFLPYEGVEGPNYDLTKWWTLFDAKGRNKGPGSSYADAFAWVMVGRDPGPITKKRNEYMAQLAKAHPEDKVAKKKWPVKKP